MIHPQPVPAPLLQQYQQFVIDPYQNPAMAGSYVAPVASTVAITPVPVPSVPNPPSWQTRKASTSADPRLAKRSANVSPPGNSSSGESSSLVPKPINISQEVNNVSY